MHGLKPLLRSPLSFMSCLDGRYLLLGSDANMEFLIDQHGMYEYCNGISKEQLTLKGCRYEEQLGKFFKLMNFVTDSAPLS